MDDDLKVAPIDKLDFRLRPLASDEEQNHEKKKHQEQRQEAKDHFQDLADAAERAHDSLSKSDSPYRFCVYREGEEVFIDVVIFDENGAVDRVIQKEISHDMFDVWIAHIEQGKGLMLDNDA